MYNGQMNMLSEWIVGGQLTAVIVEIWMLDLNELMIGRIVDCS